MGVQNRLRNMVIRNLSVGGRGSGAPITITRVIEGEFDASTGGYTDEREEVYQGSGIRVSYKTYDYKNTAIQYGDFRIYLSPVLMDGTETPKPENGDKLKLGDNEATVVSYEAWDSNDLSCGYKLQMRN